MSAPDVSLIMPAWQPRADWLQAAVASALAEDDCAIELVLVDDGNTTPLDEMLDVVDPRLRTLRVPHGGQGAALDAGIAASTGRFVRFADADDVIVRGSTAHLLRLAGDDGSTIAYGATVVCDTELRPERTISSTVTGDAVEACLLGRFTVRHVAMLFPRRVVEAAGKWDAGFRVSGDWDYVLRAIEHATVTGDTQPAVLYRRHSSSMTGRADIAAGESDRERLIARFLERHPQHRGSSLERAARAALHIDRATAYASSGMTGTALDRLRRAAPLDPAATARAGAEIAQTMARRLTHPRRLQR